MEAELTPRHTKQLLREARQPRLHRQGGPLTEPLADSQVSQPPRDPGASRPGQPPTSLKRPRGRRRPASQPASKRPRGRGIKPQPASKRPGKPSGMLITNPQGLGAASLENAASRDPRRRQPWPASTSLKRPRSRRRPAWERSLQETQERGVGQPPTRLQETQEPAASLRETQPPPLRPAWPRQRPAWLRRQRHRLSPPPHLYCVSLLERSPEHRQARSLCGHSETR